MILVDAPGSDLFESVEDGEVLQLEGGEIRRGTEVLAVGTRPTVDEIERRLRADAAVMRAQLVMGRDLLLRSLAFQACFVSAAAVPGRCRGERPPSRRASPPWTTPASRPAR